VQRDDYVPGRRRLPSAGLCNNSRPVQPRALHETPLLMRTFLRRRSFPAAGRSADRRSSNRCQSHHSRLAKRRVIFEARPTPIHGSTVAHTSATPTPIGRRGIFPRRPRPTASAGRFARRPGQGVLAAQTESPPHRQRERPVIATHSRRRCSSFRRDAGCQTRRSAARSAARGPSRRRSPPQTDGCFGVHFAASVRID